MRFDVVTLFPEFVATVAEYGVVGRAARSGRIALSAWNPRDHATDVHRTVDDRPYGGGPGMVMKIEPLRGAIRDARNANPQAPVIYLSPQGRVLDQPAVRRLARMPGLILVAGRYEGIDERLIELEVDEEWSIGDYVLSGGELPAMVVIDAVTRLLPGVLGDADSAEQDSFTEGLLDCPHYTRPEEYEGLRVPQVLLGGHHEQIARWRRKQALGRTWQRRPDLFDRLQLDEADRALLDEWLSEHEDD
ncbi:MAG: tRNA (guanosine(37)-N1)-methyltransferase TrmD [Gammaproteobacteria bacterium]|nr:MAG: tRNA (guanosine(37)-N1)-methyltransferase TrmD [Gammaproteobacteria bacterium]